LCATCLFLRVTDLGESHSSTSGTPRSRLPVQNTDSCSSLLVSYKRRGEWWGGRRARREGRQMAAVAAESEGKERGRGSSGGVGEGGCGGGEGIDGQTGRPTLSWHYVGMVDFYAGPRWRPKHGTNAPRVVLARPEAQQGSTAH
jgi:hypothetical protein